MKNSGKISEENFFTLMNESNKSNKGRPLTSKANPSHPVHSNLWPTNDPSGQSNKGLNNLLNYKNRPNNLQFSIVQI